MGSQHLGWNNRTLTGATEPGALRATNGTATTQGATLGAVSMETGGSVADQAQQRCVRFMGYNTFVAVHSTNIYRSTDAGSTWSVVYGSDADLGSTVVKSGIHLVYRLVNGEWVATLVLMTRASAGTFAMFYSTDGENWTKAGTVASLGDQSTALQGDTLWNGKLYTCAGLSSSARTYAFNYQDFTITSTSMPNMHTVCNDAYFAVLDGRLYGIWTKSGGTITLHEMRADGLWVERLEVDTSVEDEYSADRKSTLFAYNGKLYAVFARKYDTGDDQYEWKCWEIAVDGDSFEATDRSSVFEPLGPNGQIVGNPGTATQPLGRSRAAVMIDGPAGTAGQSPQILLYFATNADHDTETLGAYYAFLWNGPTAAVTDLSSSGGLTCGSAWPFGNQYGGTVFWSSGNRAVELIKRVPAKDGRQRLHFKLYSPNSAPDTVSVRAYWGRSTDENVHPTDSSCQLIDPTSGTISGQAVSGLDAADNGTTTFQVSWDAFSQATNPPKSGDRTYLVLEVAA